MSDGLNCTWVLQLLSHVAETVWLDNAGALCVDPVAPFGAHGYLTIYMKAHSIAFIINIT